MHIAIELRTTCERCGDPLPVNAFTTRIPCWSCLHDNALTPERWSMLLGSALEQASPHSIDKGVTESLELGQRTFELRWAPAHPPPGEVRPRPSEMRAELFPGLVGVIGEETDTPPTRENITFQCSQCGASLSIDGRSRLVDCAHCHSTTQLSDEAWRRMHPPHALRRWYLVVDVDAKPPKDPFPFRVFDVTTGPDGLLYAAVDSDDRLALVCLSPDLELHWRTQLKGRFEGSMRVAVVGDEVWYFEMHEHEVHRFDRGDGRSLGVLGGKEPLDAKVPHLDVRGATDLVACADGTVLVLVANRLVRFQRDGTHTLTWPPLGCLWGWLFGERVKPLYRGDIRDNPPLPGFDRPTTAYLGDELQSQLGQKRPLFIPRVSCRAATAPDGSLWLYERKLARYAPDGTCLWVVDTGDEGVALRPAIDRDLNAWLAVLPRGGMHPELIRVSASGEITRFGREGLGSPYALAATHDGRIYAFGHLEGHVRVFNQDGQRIRASAAAVQAELYEARYLT